MKVVYELKIVIPISKKRNSNMPTRSKQKRYWTLTDLNIMYDFKFDPIKAYLENTQEMIFNQEKELDEKYQNWIKEHGKNSQIPDAFDIYEMEIHNVSEYSNILNNSVFLTIYSIFENEFLKLCELCQNLENLNISPKDIKEANYIEQCQKYIKKVLKINLDRLNNEWIEIKSYQEIRNSIAHGNNIIKSPNQEIKKFIITSHGISIDLNNNKIKIDSIDFLKTFIDKLTDFLSKLIDEIIKCKEYII